MLAHRGGMEDAAMGRYRKADTRMWGDAKFRRLSPPPPCGQSLWLWFILGPHNTNLPGLFVSGEASMAEALKWPLKGFRLAFEEIVAQGMAKADWDSRVVWIPNAIKYNVPSSPNVVKSWAENWEEVCECAIKEEAAMRFLAFFEDMSPKFTQEFISFADLPERLGESLPERNSKPSRKALAKEYESFQNAFDTPFGNQEQEQEQEQEQDNPPSPKGGDSSGRAKTKKPQPENQEPPLSLLPSEFNCQAFLESWAELSTHRKEKKVALTDTTTRALAKQFSGWGLETTIAAITRSIANGWRGVFPETSTAGSKNKGESVKEAMARIRARKKAEG